MKNQLEKRHIRRLFVAGHTRDEIAELLNRPNVTSTSPFNMPELENLFEEYLAMTLSEKQQILLEEQIACRMYHLMDGVADLKRVNALLKEAGVKTCIPLLGIKQKIRELTAKKNSPQTDKNISTEELREDTKGIIDECYNRVFGKPQRRETQNRMQE
jgi:hypothetical protein